MSAEAKVRKLLKDSGFSDAGGDVDLTYGARFAKEVDKNEFYVLEVIDLDSGAGAAGLLMVQMYHVGYDYADHKGVKATCDTKSWLPGLARKDKAMARLMYAAEIATYGGADAGTAVVCLFDPSWYDSRAEGNAEVEKWTSPRGMWGLHAVSVPGWGYAALHRAIDRAISRF